MSLHKNHTTALLKYYNKQNLNRNYISIDGMKLIQN